MGLRLAGAAFWFWQPRGYWREGLKWLEETLARNEQEQWTPERAKAIVAAGYVAQHMSAASMVENWFEQSLEFLRKRHDGWWTAYTLDFLGWCLLYACDAESAQERFKEAVGLAHGMQDDWILGNSLRGLGAALQRFDHSAARPLVEESVTLLRDAGDAWSLADAVNQLGCVAWGQHDYAQATVLFEEALRIYEKMGERAMSFQPIFNLAWMMLSQGHGRRAEHLLRECLVVAKNVGLSTGVGLALTGFGDLAAAHKLSRRSAILLAAGEYFLNSIDKPIAIWPWFNIENECYKIIARTQLGEAGFAKATAEGRAMTLEQAIEFALETTH